MESDDDGKDHKEGESDGMRIAFERADFRRTSEAPEWFGHGHEKKPSAIERGNRKQVENAQIYGEQRADRENDRSAHPGIHELHEEPADGDRPAHAFGRLFPIGFGNGKEELFYDLPEHLERETRLRDGFFGPGGDGLEKAVPVFERPIVPYVRVSDVRADFRIHGDGGNVENVSGPDDGQYGGNPFRSRKPYPFGKLFGRTYRNAVYGRDDIARTHSGLLGGRSGQRGELDTGNVEDAQLDGTIESRNEPGFDRARESGIDGQGRNARIEEARENEKRENEVESDPGKQDRRPGEVRLRSEGVGVATVGFELVLAPDSDEPSNRQPIERVFRSFRIATEGTGLGGDADSEFFHAHAGHSGKEEMPELMEQDRREEYGGGEEDSEDDGHGGSENSRTAPRTEGLRFATAGFESARFDGYFFAICSFTWSKRWLIKSSSDRKSSRFEAKSSEPA